MESRRSSPYSPTLPLPVIKLLLLLIGYLPFLRASPVALSAYRFRTAEAEPLPAQDAALWIYLAVAAALVLIGGAFAGLTIALMGQDEIYLQVIKTSGEGSERKNAARVLRLLKRGKHWVLVTLLLGNVITNETLPIVLDRSLGGGWPAVLGSTVLIVIFGEIIPQSVCVRYGLPIGAWMSPLVLVLMYILAPAAWPTAKLLDYLLGEEHGTTYKKAGLKTLVTLHKSLGDAGEQLNQDEVTIISAVLDLKEKPVGSIMTPMDDVFTMSADTILDEKTMDIILGAGYSRIPIYAPDNPSNFVGMLLVKILITYDPEDGKRVRDFALATLPETRAETSCLDIVNFFQEGKSHMVLVSEYPGDDRGALGVVTLEDVIEELIGEEIIDESDVFIDVHKAIRRMAPAPKSRVPKGEIIEQPDDTMNDNLIETDQKTDATHPGITRAPTTDGSVPQSNAGQDLAASPRRTSALRRTSSVQNASDRESQHKRATPAELREQFKHLGPSNPASRPRTTRYNTIKVKPTGGTFADVHQRSIDTSPRRGSGAAASGGVGAGLISSAGKDAKDGVLAVQAGYGTMSPGSPPLSKTPVKSSLYAHAEEEARKSREILSQHLSRTGSGSTLGSMQSGNPSPRKRGTARSGSITENVVDSGGIRKTVLEMTSSSSSDDAGGAAGTAKTGNGAKSDYQGRQAEGIVNGAEQEVDGKSGRKKRRRKKRKGGTGETDPLL